MENFNSIDDVATHLDNVNISDENDHFSTLHEISLNFDKAQQTYSEYDDCIIKTPHEEQIRLLKKLEKSIIMHGIFSPNEDFKEISTENIK